MTDNSTNDKYLDKVSKIKLSYENIIHKKVYHFDYCAIIPEGIKCFAVFMALNKTDSYEYVIIDAEKKIIIAKESCAFVKQEYIFYGTMFTHLSKSFFCVEDLLHCKNNTSWLNKLKLLKSIFNNNLKREATTVAFGLPIMCKSDDELNKKIKNIKYKIHSVQYKLLNKINHFLYIPYNEIENNTNAIVPSEKHFIESTKVNTMSKKISDAVFLVKADAQDDIYHLYTLNDKKEETYYSIAHIKDYQTSVMMNSLFRIIKENDNLDSLEESDDEEEFQDEDNDKFLKKNIEYKMICTYNYRFKKWCPYKTTNRPITLMKIVNSK